MLFSLPSVEFENLGKAFSKAKSVVDKEGVPQFYIRGLTELEDFVKEVSKNITNNKISKYKDLTFLLGLP